MQGHVKPNYVALGRQYNADYRAAVKKAFEEAQSGRLKTTKIIKKPKPAGTL